MADAPIGISFMPTADAAVNGPRQAGIEGQGGSDLAAAFKILSLHLPRVLGAASIAPKRLLDSPGSAGVATPVGSSPYAAVFQALLQSIAGNMQPGSDVASLSSLYGGGIGPSALDTGTPTGGSDSGTGGSGGITAPGVPPPLITPGSGEPKTTYGGPLPTGAPTDYGTVPDTAGNDTYYI